MGLLATFFVNFLHVFESKIFHLQQSFLYKFLSLTSIPKGEFIKSVSLDFLKRIFLSFSPQNLSSFLTQAWAIHCYIHPIGILICESVCLWSREVITMCHTIVIWGVRSCGLSELAGSYCILFLREQVRDLRVQEFLRELVVGVVAPSNLAGSFLVETFIAVKAGM